MDKQAFNEIINGLSLPATLYPSSQRNIARMLYKIDSNLQRFCVVLKTLEDCKKVMALCYKNGFRWMVGGDVMRYKPATVYAFLNGWIKYIFPLGGDVREYKPSATEEFTVAQFARLLKEYNTLKANRPSVKKVLKHQKHLAV